MPQAAATFEIGQAVSHYRISRFLYFGNLVSTGSSDASEWRITVGDHAVEKIMELYDESRYWGWWSTWSTVGPDGGVCFTRDRSIQEIYALHLSER